MKSISIVIAISGLFLSTLLPTASTAGEKTKVEKVRSIKGLKQTTKDGVKVKKLDKDGVQSFSGVVKPKPKPKPEPKPDPCNDGSGTDPDCDNDEDEDRDVDTDGFDTPMTIEG